MTAVQIGSLPEKQTVRSGNIVISGATIRKREGERGERGRERLFGAVLHTHRHTDSYTHTHTHTGRRKFIRSHTP